MSKRRKFTKEFKQEAVRLVDEPGVTCAQIARDLGINANMLSRWRRELAADDRRAFRGHGQSRDEDLTAVRRELARVKKEQWILRLAGSPVESEGTGECCA